MIHRVRGVIFVWLGALLNQLVNAALVLLLDVAVVRIEVAHGASVLLYRLATRLDHARQQVARLWCTHADAEFVEDPEKEIVILPLSMRAEQLDRAQRRVHPRPRLGFKDEFRAVGAALVRNRGQLQKVAAEDEAYPAKGHQVFFPQGAENFVQLVEQVAAEHGDFVNRQVRGISNAPQRVLVLTNAGNEHIDGVATQANARKPVNGGAYGGGDDRQSSERAPPIKVAAMPVGAVVEIRVPGRCFKAMMMSSNRRVLPTPAPPVMNKWPPLIA